MKMTQREYLKNEYYEEMPEFLADYVKGKKFNYKKFFNSRIVYYPGAGTDGHPVDIFAASHSCHCFIYSDFLMSKDDYINELYTNGFKGYKVYDIIDFDINKVFNNYKSKYLDDIEYTLIKKHSEKLPYGIMVIINREDELDDEYGPLRIAVMFLGIDSILAYDMIFASRVAKNLFACLIQDHGFGGGYDSFGATGIMYKLAKRSNVFPELILMVDEPNATNLNKIWPNYVRILDVDGSHGGMHHNYRFLFKQNI